MPREARTPRFLGVEAVVLLLAVTASGAAASQPTAVAPGNGIVVEDGWAEPLRDPSGPPVDLASVAERPTARQALRLLEIIGFRRTNSPDSPPSLLEPLGSWSRVSGLAHPTPLEPLSERPTRDSLLLVSDGDWQSAPPAQESSPPTNPWRGRPGSGDGLAGAMSAEGLGQDNPLRSGSNLPPPTSVLLPPSLSPSSPRPLPSGSFPAPGAVGAIPAADIARSVSQEVENADRNPNRKGVEDSPLAGDSGHGVQHSDQGPAARSPIDAISSRRRAVKSPSTADLAGQPAPASIAQASPEAKSTCSSARVSLRRDVPPAINPLRKEDSIAPPDPPILLADDGPPPSNQFEAGPRAIRELPELSGSTRGSADALPELAAHPRLRRTDEPSVSAAVAARSTDSRKELEALGMIVANAGVRAGQATPNRVPLEPISTAVRKVPFGSLATAGTIGRLPRVERYPGLAVRAPVRCQAAETRPTEEPRNMQPPAKTFLAFLPFTSRRTAAAAAPVPVRPVVERSRGEGALAGTGSLPELPALRSIRTQEAPATASPRPSPPGKAGPPQAIASTAVAAANPMPSQTLQPAPPSAISLRQPASEVAAPATGASRPPLQLGLRENRVLRTRQFLVKAVSSNESICQAIQLSGYDVTLVTKAEGVTRIELWFDAQGSSRASLDVDVRAEHQAGRLLQRRVADIQRVVNEMFPDGRLELVCEGDRVVVRGRARSQEQAVDILSTIRRSLTIPVVDQVTIDTGQ